MSEKGFSVLQSLIDNHYESMIECVVQAKDNNVQNDFYQEIHSLCIENKIPVFDKKEKPSIQSPYCIAISWRWIIPISETNKLIVLHDSLLPKYRGFAPLVNMLINSEERVGVTALFANKEFDRGDIIAQRSAKVQYPIRIQDAIELISPLYAQTVVDIFSQLSAGQSLASKSQNEQEASYSLWRDEEDYHIDWSDEASSIQQMIFSVGYPYKGAYSLVEGEKLRIIDCETVEDVVIENRTPGKILFMEEGKPVVVCGKGLLRLTQVTNDEGVNMLPLQKFRLRFK